VPTPACAVPLNWGAAEKWGAKKFFRPVPPPTLNLLPMTLKDKDKEPGKESKDVWICEACRNEYKDDNSRLLESERCEGHFCAKRMKITDEVNDMVTQRKDFHWHCGVCGSKENISVCLL